MIELPAIEIEDPDDGGAALRESRVAGIDSYDWLVLTSANGARRFLAELRDAASTWAA